MAIYEPPIKELLDFYDDYLEDWKKRGKIVQVVGYNPVQPSFEDFMGWLKKRWEQVSGQPYINHNK